MKKKLFCLLAAMVMMFGLAACGDKDGGASDSGKSDFDAFMEVQKNMQDIKDAEFKMNMDMDMNMSGSETVNTTMTATCKEILKDKNDIQMEMKYKMSIPALETDMDGIAYIKDGVVYMDLMGQKVKVDGSNEMASMMQTVDTNEMLNITNEMVSDLQVKTEGSDTIYSFKMDPAKAIDYFKSNVKSYGDLSALADLSFDHMNVVITTDDKQMVKKMDMDCAMASTIKDDEDEKNKDDNATMDLSYKVTVEYVNINTDLKIDFPDFSKYQELTV